MKTNFKTLSFLFILINTALSCSTKWTTVINRGSISYNTPKHVINIETQNNLIIVPIVINGHNYRFLFDTGAPFSISKKLQDKHNFKTISKSNIIDSDNNKKQVKWVQVNTINIGNVAFLNQTAFIGDFKANAVLKCLKIDGIIGSNLIRHSNWTINQNQNTLTLLKKPNINLLKESIAVPFKTDQQYNIFIDLNLGQAKIKNVLLDYGSNGSLSINNQIYSVLKKKHIINKSYIEKGVNQSGIIGTPVPMHREITYSDSLNINQLQFKNTILKTGHTVSVGNGLLSRSQVTINWNNKHIYLSKPKHNPIKNNTIGFKLGYSINKGIYIQSVIENSNAYNQGIRPNMKVLKINNLDFTNGNDFCDYVSQEFGNETYLQILNSNNKKIDYTIKKTYF